MDEGLSRAVLEVFVRLYERDLVYRDKYMVNWCPHHQTALANDEVDHHHIPELLGRSPVGCGGPDEPSSNNRDLVAPHGVPSSLRA